MIMSARIASEEQIAAAAAAVELGESLAREHWQAAAQTPGVGWQVSLPSFPRPGLGPVQGEGYNLPADSPALSSPAPRRLIPEYGAPAVGGAAHHGTQPQPGTPTPFDGIPWPSPGRRSSVAYISPGPRPSITARIRRAFEVLRGRR